MESPYSNGANDVRMHELDGDLALGRTELFDRGARRGRLVLLGQLDLEADGPARLVIDGPINPGHAAARHLGDEREPALEVHATAIPLRSARRSGTEHFLQLAEHRDALLVLKSRSGAARFRHRRMRTAIGPMRRPDRTSSPGDFELSRPASRLSQIPDEHLSRLISYEHFDPNVQFFDQAAGLGTCHAESRT